MLHRRLKPARPVSLCSPPQKLAPRQDIGVSRANLRKFFSTLDNQEFGLKDFEKFFQVNKAKAFLWVTALVKEGVISHNGQKTVKVRYTPACGWERRGF